MVHVRDKISGDVGWIKAELENLAVFYSVKQHLLSFTLLTLGGVLREISFCFQTQGKQGILGGGGLKQEWDLASILIIWLIWFRMI